MYHSLIINVGDNYIDTWDDWKLIPSSRPVIAPPIERTKFVTVPGRDGALDYSRTPANRPTYDDRTGKIEFYLENDYAGWDWDQFKSDKGHSKITLEYNLHPTMYTLKVEAVALNVYDLKLNRGMEYQLLVGVGPTNTFYRKINVTTKPRDVVKITQNGTILALRKGTAVVTAECGGVKAECAVTVGAYESFTIERALDGVSETNPVGSIVAGMSYQNVFNVGDSEKEMLELTVEMGGTDVTGSYVVMAKDNASAQIKMASVTGNIKIAAHAAAKPVAAMLCNDTLPVEVKPLKRVEGAFRLGR